MERKQFLKTCGLGCIASVAGISLLQSCGTSQIINKEIIGSDIVVPIADFEIKNNLQKQFKKYIIIQNDKLTHPICVYRFSETEYSALFMACTHQNAELQVFGDKLQCAAHGSEFNNRGIVENGPANLNLKKFPVVIENTILKISLK
jgi:Rieske Fe-S protein